jgi:hypothetical protein
MTDFTGKVYTNELTNKSASILGKFILNIFRLSQTLTACTGGFTTYDTCVADSAI